MKEQGKTAYVEIVARIINAQYDYYKGNNEYRVIYYPPPLLPAPLPPGEFNVTVRVYEYNLTANMWMASAGATVEVYYGTDINATQPMYTGTTNETGVVIFTLKSGTWTFRATKEGFTEALATVPLYNATTVSLYLSPMPSPPAENRTYIRENVTVTFNVYDATNGNAIPNALITLTYIGPENSSYYGSTFETTTSQNGVATIELPIGIYNVTVTATGYNEFHSKYLFDKNTVVNIALVPGTVNVTEYARLEVRVFYADGKPYTGAHVEVRNATDNSLIAALATNSYGNATLLLPKNHDYKVDVKVYEPLYNRSYEDSALVSLTQDTVVTFIVPWNSTQPPTTINATPYYWLTVQVVWGNGLPFYGANVTVYNYTSGEKIGSLLTDATGTAHFILPAFQYYVVWVNATNPFNMTQNYQTVLILNLTDNRWLTIWLPWTPSYAEIAAKYRVLVYAYNIVNGTGIPGVTIVMRKGDVAWTAETNSTGYAELWVPFLGLYNVTGIHPDYQAVWRLVQIYDNNTLINLPMSPIQLNFTKTPPPPLNGTYPPIYINGTPYYWLSVQVVYKDGYPYHGANVTVIDLETNLTLATGVTNGTGFVHFLIPANKTIKYTVDAYNPALNETYHAERVVNMTQHYYFVHVLPWTSKYFSPEVWLKEVHFIIHRGQGYYLGNVSHLVLLSIWTNKPQNVTVLIALYNVNKGEWVVNKTVTVSLSEGLNTMFEWISINASTGGRYRVFANITSWEYDTDPTNNWAWSEERFLKPLVDIQVFIVWRPVHQKQGWTILPEDIIEIDIGIKLPTNTSSIPAKLAWKIEKYDFKLMKIHAIMGAEEEIRTVKPGIVWRNITILVPWTSKIVVVANVTHPWEDFGFNNIVNVTIPIDPDIKIEVLKKPNVVAEGSTFRVVVNITSNVEPGKGIGWVTVVDNTTATILKRVEIMLAPQKTLELEVKAPENPREFWIIRRPTATHTMVAQVTGYDLYPENNRVEFKITVMSNQWVAVTAIIVILIAMAAALKAIRHTVHDIRQNARRFVKRRKFLTESIWDDSNDDRARFVQKKRGGSRG
jgi:hypothetical protein